MTFSNFRAITLMTVLVSGLSVVAQDPASGVFNEGRNYDMRPAYNHGLRLTPPAEAQAELLKLRQSLPGLMTTNDPYQGTTRTMYRASTYLTTPNAVADALEIGMDFVVNNLSVFGLTEEDLAEFEITDRVYSAVSGATHLYLRQIKQGIPVYNGQLQFNVNREGRLIGVNNQFVANLGSNVAGRAATLTPEQAIASVSQHLGLVLPQPVKRLSETQNTTRDTRLQAPGFSLEEVNASLVWLPVRAGDTRLAWNFQIYTLDQNHIYDLTVDAESGLVLTRFDWVASEDYKVYPWPIESPNHASTLPPADGRVTEIDPADPSASPFGWHDTDGQPGAEHTTLQGNNVHAYEDSDANNAPPAVEPDGGANLIFSFPMDLTQQPASYIDAAAVELFYWNNVIHDVLWQYGFDEAGGNFQENNYGNGGLGGDSVNAEAQDGIGINNANFSTPPDGLNPRMQMFRFNITNPNRDGDFDHGIITHEFGHGTSNRLVGGPSNTSCMGTTQQPGEGVSDWHSLIFTTRTGMLGTDTRGMGTYVLGQPINGPGIRPQPYSTNPAVNTYTYETIGSGVSVPHGVGSVWAQAAWEVYWALVDVHGFDENIYNANGGAGNQRAILYGIEGMKNTACGPSFLDFRDGIIQAATDLNGGEDVCTIWAAFAAFGLGEDATTNGPNSLTAHNGFAVPASCNCVAPDAPTDLVANSSAGVIDLSWSGTGPFNVYRADRDCQGTFELLVSGVSDTSFLDTNVDPGNDYAYQVRATDANGDCVSDASNCVTQTACDTLLNLAAAWNNPLTILDILECL